MSVRRLNSTIPLVVSVLILAGCSLFQSEPSPTVALTATPGASIQQETVVDSHSQGFETATEEAPRPHRSRVPQSGWQLHRGRVTNWKRRLTPTLRHLKPQSGR